MNNTRVFRMAFASVYPHYIAKAEKKGTKGEVHAIIHWLTGYAAGADTLRADGLTLFTALREQLGLRLDSSRAAVEVLVVDHAEPPTPD